MGHSKQPVDRFLQKQLENLHRYDQTGTFFSHQVNFDGLSMDDGLKEFKQFHWLSEQPFKQILPNGERNEGVTSTGVFNRAKFLIAVVVGMVEYTKAQ